MQVVDFLFSFSSFWQGVLCGLRYLPIPAGSTLGGIELKADRHLPTYG